ncbi:Dps family protein [Rhodohalobacter halophilus]|uniref:Dps family protein n=1 Tax=Rhodohalobacter halophilus TaxID=1812810 RepID=UPI00083FCBA0|nr:Dps family protein [Rhodohalobacter halophilus]
MITTEERVKEEVNIGISTVNRGAIANELSRVLADSYVLYLKTHNYHWNVTGKFFHSLHEQFEEQYSELAEAVDVIAERIRALGFRAPGTFKEYRELTSIEEDADQPDAMEMVRRLVVGNEQVLRTAREALKPAQKGEDEATIDLLTQRLNTHSKTAWMLRSHLE